MGAKEAEAEKAKKEKEQKEAAEKRKAAQVDVLHPPFCPGQLRADPGKPPLETEGGSWDTCASEPRPRAGQFHTDLGPPSCVWVGPPGPGGRRLFGRRSVEEGQDVLLGRAQSGFCET